MRIDTSLAQSGLIPLNFHGHVAVSPADPRVIVRRVVVQGDSISAVSPSTYSSTFYSHRFADRRPDLFVEVRAQGSRTVGNAALGDVLDDNGNTLLGNVTEDMAYAPDLITWFIGANDITNTRSAAAYMNGMITLRLHYRTVRLQCRVAWSPPLPYNPTGTPHPTFNQFTANRAALFAANPRDPAVWGQWCDYYLPLGEYPDFAVAASAAPLFNDGVHPSMAGQTLLLASYSAAIESIADASRTNSTVAYHSVWPTSETDLAANSQIVRRFIISGIAHSGMSLGVAVSGGGAQIRLNGGEWRNSVGTRSSDGYRIYNGDVVDLRLITSAMPSTAVNVMLAIGSETRTISYATVADVEPVAYAHQGHHTFGSPALSRTFEMTVAQSGLGVIAVSADAPGTTVMVGGVAATHRFRQERTANVALDIFTVPVGAGTHSAVVTYPASRSRHCISFGVLRNAQPVPVETVGSATPNQSSPHATPGFTVPANGLALAFYMAEGIAQATTPPTCNSPTAFVAHGHATYQSGYRGITVGQQTASGAATFAYQFGSYARAAIVFRAVGT